MRLIQRDGITTRNDGLPYDVLKIAQGHYQFRAIGNPDKPLVLAITETLEMAITMLILQAPEQVN